MSVCTATLPESAYHSGPCVHPAYASQQLCLLHMAKDGWTLNHPVFSAFYQMVGTELQGAYRAQVQMQAPILAGSIPDYRGAIIPAGFPISHIGPSNTLPCVDFSNAVFIGDFDFTKFLFLFHRLFASTNFRGAATFDQSQMHSTAGRLSQSDFSGCIFDGKASFVSSDSGQGVFKLNGATFNQGLDCSQLAGTGPKAFRIRQGDFSAITVRGIANFEGVVFDEDTHFDKARFEPLGELGSLVNFHATEFVGDVSFTAAKFHVGVTFSSAAFRRTSSFKQAEFGSAPVLTSTTFGEDTNFEKAKFRSGNAETFRKIKRLMEDQKHNWEATLFHARELEEERRSFTPRLHRDYILNWIYFGINDYGRNWTIPFGWLAIVWLSFAVAYNLADFEVVDQGSLAGWQRGISGWSRCGKGMFYSLQSLRLGGIFGKELLIPVAHGWWWASLIESVLGVVLLTMGILSLRRRFKI